MSSLYFAEFAVFSFAFIFISIGMVRAANYLYGKLGTYHPTRFHSDHPGAEKLFMKGSKVALYNFITVLSIVALVIFYSRTPIGAGMGLSVGSVIALVGVALILNFSIRVGALANIPTEFHPDILGRAQSFGFGFMLSIYFLMLFGAGTYVINNGFNIEFSGNIGEFANETAILLTSVFAGPIVAAVVSEALLLPIALDVVPMYIDSIND